MKDTGVNTGFVGVEFQHAANIAKPGSDSSITEFKGDRLTGDNFEVLNEANSSELLQSSFVSGVSGAVLALDCVIALDRQGRDLSMFSRRDSLDIGDDIDPVTVEPQEAVEEWVEILQVFGEDGIIDSAGKQRTAGHQEKVFNGIREVAEQIVCKISAGNVIEPVHFSGVGECGNSHLRCKHTCGEQSGIAAACDIKGAVRVFLANGQ